MVAAGSLRVVFFGTPAFAVPTLDAILASRHAVVGVVTQPDKPRGRGQKVSDAPVKARATERRLPLLQPARLNDEGVLAALRAFNADVGVVAAYGKILTDAVLAVPRLGMINVHASLLPRYRGAAPVHRAVIAGDTETGVTIMRVVKALDAGPMLLSAARAIGPDETSEDVEAGLSTIGASLIVDALDRLATGTLTGQPQDEQRATYAPRLTKEDGLIDWERGGKAIHDLVRGLYPWPHAYTFLGDRRIIVWRASHEATGTHALPGTVVAARHDGVGVAVGDGIVWIRELQLEGKRPLPAREFLAGHPIPVGARFDRRPHAAGG
jgi:methionyl-tRNA formyltransferase